MTQGPPTSGEDPAFVKLANMLGPAKANALVRELMREIGRSSLETSEDRLLFGEALVRRGGLLAAIGRAIKVQAIFMGAHD